MIGIFTRRNAFQLPALIFFAVLVKLLLMPAGQTQQKAGSGGLLDKFIYTSIYGNLHPVFIEMLAICLILGAAVYLNYLVTMARMFQRPQFLTALSVVLFVLLFPGAGSLQAGVVMMPLSVLLYQQLTRLYNSPHPRTVVVNAGLITGTGILLYHPYWWMVPVCMLALVQLRPFRLHEWVLLLVSIATPAYFLLSYEYLTNQWNPKAHWPVWNPIKTIPAIQYEWVILFTAALFWSAAGLLRWQHEVRRMLIQSRKNWYLLLTIGVFTIPSLFFPRGNVAEGLALSALAAAPFAAHAFTGQGRPIRYNLVLIIIIGLIVVSSFWQQLGKI
jgi:hypothetical protein